MRKVNHTVIACREVELLLCCARTRLESQHASRITVLVQEELNWEYIIDTANHHGVMPLLYSNVNAICRELTPTHVLNTLQKQFLINAQHNLLFAAELIKILSLLEAYGIHAIPFKGPVLASEAYRSLALRQFCDLDILVHDADVLRVKDLLIAYGYKPEFSLTQAQEQAYLRSQCEYNFTSDDGRIPIEIHWRFVPQYFPYTIEAEDMWKRARQIYLAGKQVWSFSAEDLLLILSLHGMKHAWDRLALICDMVELIRMNQQMDWERVARTADRFKLGQVLFVGLGVAFKHCKEAIADKLLERLQSDTASLALADRIYNDLFQERRACFEKVRCFFFHVQTYAHWRHRCEFALRRVLTPNFRDLLMLQLPKSLYFFYYLLRPGRLLYDFLTAVKSYLAKTDQLDRSLGGTKIK